MKLTGAQIIVKCLIDHGVDTVFGYPGGFVIDIYDELFKAKDKITHVTACHEQGAAHAADGYARASGKVGVVIATSGPGATNLVTGIAAAYLDSTPLVAITGNVPLSLLGKDSFQEVDTTGITMPITKHNFIVKDINSLAKTLHDAFVIAQSGRKGPVLVDIPKNIQITKCDYKACLPIPQEATFPPKACVDKAVSLINNSKKPFIYAGGGVVSANATLQLKQLATAIEAPIGCSIMGLTAISRYDDSALGLTGMHGGYLANKIMSESDLLIAVGARFSDRATGDKQAFIKDKQIIHIDIDPAEINKNIPVETYLTGDVKSVLEHLITCLPCQKRQDWQDYITIEKQIATQSYKPNTLDLNPQHIMQTIKKHAKDAIIATDVGQHQMWTAQYYEFENPRTFITSGGLGAMGFGLGAAIGASIAQKQRAVLITSDGSFHMNLNEMATAVSQNVPITVIILNNNALGMVRQWQTLFYEKRYSNTTLSRKTDYVALANAFGAAGFRVTNVDELDTQIAKAMAINSPTLVEIIVDENQRVLPMIPPGKSINDIITE